MNLFTPTTGCWGEVRTLTESLNALCFSTRTQLGWLFPSKVLSNYFSSKMITGIQLPQQKSAAFQCLSSSRGELEKCEDLDEKEQWFQLDGALPHTANVGMA